MNVTEILMKAGRWSCQFQRLPVAELNQLLAAERQLDGQLVVFDTDVDSPSFGQARYSGVISRREGVEAFGGYGPHGMLGTDLGVGPRPLVNTHYAAKTPAEWAAILIDGDVTVGTVNATGAASATVSATWFPSDTARMLLDQVCGSFNLEARVNPDFTLDIATADRLFRDTPTVLVTEQPTSEGSGGGSLAGINGQISTLTESNDNATSRVVAAGAGEGENVEIYTAAVTNSDYGRGSDGTVRSMRRFLDLPSSSGTELSSLAAASLTRFNGPSFDLGITASTRGIRRLVEPGDNVYAWFPSARVSGSAAVGFAGEDTFPIVVRVLELAWQSHVGQGVWLHRNTADDGDIWTRLTPWTVFGNGSSTWRVSTDRGTSDRLLSEGTG